MRRFLQFALCLLLGLPSILAQTNLPLLGVGGGGAAPISIINSRTQNLGANGGTTTATDMTGANLCVASFVSNGNATAISSVSSSPANTWVFLTGSSSGAPGARTRMAYVYAPTVSSTMTFTATKTSGYVAVTFACFANTIGSAADQENGATGSGSPILSLATGSVTPGFNNELIIATVGNFYGATGYSVNSSFTIIGSSTVASTDFHESTAYIVQTTAGAVNPTFSWSDGGANSPSASARIATFR